MIKFVSLSSGSSGNCYYFTNGSTTFLIDAGIGPRRIKKILSEYSLDLESVNFILITHDHIDHIKSLGVIVNRYHKLVYTSDLLKSSLLNHSITRNTLKGSINCIEISKENNIQGVKVTPFLVPHDATQTLGYFIEFENKKITLVTDCGEVTDEILNFSKKADILIFESNYDDKMLLNGAYPAVLKNRIKNSHLGHLSNNEACEALKKIFSDREGSLEYLFLCHLSGNNNTPEIAYNTVTDGLKSIGVDLSNRTILTLPRGKASNLYTF